VWLHGGAFVMGTGATPLYAGGRMAHRGDAVIVTINYRLGALGFLNLRGVLADPPPCNLGIRDQVAALEWVRDNIENFGGDPENVTVFGESAGAMSVGTLLGIPTARGLFHRALLESGAASNVATAQQAGLAAEAFVDELGARDLALLEQAPVSALLAAQRAATLRLGFRTGALPWQPSVDGDFLPAAPLESVGKGDARDIPLLVGTNRDEWKLFSLADRAGRRMDDAGLLRRFERALPRDAAERALAAYRDALGARARPFDLWETFQSDRMFHYPAHRLAGLQSAHAPTYAYVFDWAPPGLGARIGACHGLEIPFVFGTLREPLLRPVFAWTPGARRLSDRMQRAWLEFARCGDPRHDDLPEWPTYDDNRRATMRLGTECVVRDDPFARARSFWGERERS
jgi:para-nitrobenzyl esterase